MRGALYWRQKAAKAARTPDVSTKKAVKVVFGDDDDVSELLLKASNEVGSGQDGARDLDGDFDADEGDDDAPEAVSISDSKKREAESRRNLITKEKSKKIESKAAQKEREEKGRQLKLQKEQKKQLVAAKEAKQVLDMSIFEEAERSAKVAQLSDYFSLLHCSRDAVEEERNRGPSARIRTRAAATKRVFNDTDLESEPAKKKRRPAKQIVQRIGGFTIVPLDASLVKQKPVAKSVTDFQKDKLFGSRIQRKPVLSTMARAKDGAPPNFRRK
ncbi:hypothetical protein BC830DRAFT_454061 [Chytriomyces sp. MP71]|nr:hypothetical protein BC830DRAFT_454061 [Chytriomyces sp. MP71]